MQTFLPPQVESLRLLEVSCNHIPVDLISDGGFWRIFHIWECVCDFSEFGHLSFVASKCLPLTNLSL